MLIYICPALRGDGSGCTCIFAAGRREPMIEKIKKLSSSMAFTVTFTPRDEEFTAESVDGYVHKILKNLKKELDIELRV